MSSSHVTQQPRRRPVGEALGERPARSTVPLAWAGIIGPVLFTAAFLAQEAFLVDDYSPIAEPVSALEAQPHGWVQQINFVVFALLTVAFAVGLRRGLPPTSASAVGPALFVVSGVGLLGAAIFPLREDAAGVTYYPGGHVVAGTAFFLSSALALVVVSRVLARDRRWRSLATYTLAAGVAALAGGVITNVLVRPDAAALHDFAGLVQRLVILVVLFPCRIALSLRLLQVASGRR